MFSSTPPSPSQPVDRSTMPKKAWTLGSCIRATSHSDECSTMAQSNFAKPTISSEVISPLSNCEPCGPVHHWTRGSVRILAPLPNLKTLSDKTSTKAEDAAGSGNRAYKCGSSSVSSLAG